MGRHRPARRPAHSAKHSAHRAATRLGILFGAVAAVSILIVSLTGSTSVAASGTSAPGQVKEKHYKATRPFVVDKQTGQVRMPTQQEVDEVVANLSSFGQRPADTLQQSAQPGARSAWIWTAGSTALFWRSRMATGRGRPSVSSPWRTVRSSSASSRTILLDKGDAP